MDDQEGQATEAVPAGDLDGTSAVLYGMFTSFTEVLGSFEARLERIESALRSGPRAGTGDDVAEVVALLRAQSELLDHRTAALAEAVAACRALLQSHVDDSAQSLGRRAGEAGRRLASDLGLRSRQPRDY